MVDRKEPNRQILRQILDRARWAPSGDNTQPWRFEIIADDELIVHGFDTRETVVYDFEGHASHLAHGALLETIRIAASVYGLAVSWVAEANDDWSKIRYVVRFRRDAEVSPDPLAAFIETRVVQRRRMKMLALTETEKQRIIASVGNLASVEFYESRTEKYKIAKLLWLNAYVRLTCPEAYEVHRDVIEWGVTESKDKIPDAAIGVDPVTAKLMRWVMGSWKRVNFFNTYLFGTVLPRIQLDFMPAIYCGAHLIVKPKAPPVTLEEWLAHGGTIQRIWLTVSSLGIYLQPEMTPIIFRWYKQHEVPVSRDQVVNNSAGLLITGFNQIFNCSISEPAVFLCRVGSGVAPKARSIRMSVEELSCKKVNLQSENGKVRLDD